MDLGESTRALIVGGMILLLAGASASFLVTLLQRSSTFHLKHLEVGMSDLQPSGSHPLSTGII